MIVSLKGGSLAAEMDAWPESDHDRLDGGVLPATMAATFPC
jgi:hypothetical protein